MKVIARVSMFKLLLLTLALGCKDSNKYSADKFHSLNDTSDYLGISYIGNMGVLLENKNKTVLIDGFHKKYKPAYLHPSKGMVDSLIRGKYAGFTRLELSLVTHKHKDHFSPELSLHFLTENKESLLIGPDQVKEELIKIDNDGGAFLDQLKVIDTENKTPSIQHKGILIQSIKCGHTYQIKHKNVQNVAYLIDINGYKVLHVGDTEWDLSKEAFEKLQLAESNIDVAILPFWMLIEENSKSKLNDLIRPKMTVATHLDPNFAHQFVEKIQLSMPDVVCLTQPNKTINYKKGR